MQDLGIEKLHVITPSSDAYAMAEHVEVTSLARFLLTMQKQ